MTKATRKSAWPEWLAGVRLSVPLLIILVVIVAVAVYVRTLSHASFRADDFGWIAVSATPQGVMWDQVLSYYYTSLSYYFPRLAEGAEFYRPLVYTYHALTYEVWDVNALGYVLNNVLLRAATAALVALIALELSARRWVGLLAGLLFAFYPTHPFSMNYANDLPNVLATAFYLLALFAYLRFRGGKGGGYLYLSLGAFALALLSKEIAASLPVVVLIYEFYRRTPWRGFVLPVGAFGAMTAGYFALRYLALGQLLGGYSDMPRDPTAILPTLARFLGLMLAPYNPNLLGRDYSLTYLVTLFVTILLILALASRAKLRTLALFLAAFLVTFLPNIPLFMGILDGNPGYGKMDQTRHVYLASAFFCVGLALLTSCLNRRALRWFVAAGLVVFYVIVQPLNNQSWLVASNLVRSAQQDPSQLPVSTYQGAIVFPYFPQFRGYQGYEYAMDPWFRGSPLPSDLEDWRDWHKAEGTLVTLDEGADTLELDTDEGLETFTFEPENLQIRLLGNPEGLQSLKAGQKAIVGSVEEDGQKIARSVEVYRR